VRGKKIIEMNVEAGASLVIALPIGELVKRKRREMELVKRTAPNFLPSPSLVKHIWLFRICR